MLRNRLLKTRVVAHGLVGTDKSFRGFYPPRQIKLKCYSPFGRQYTVSSNLSCRGAVSL